MKPTARTPRRHPLVRDPRRQGQGAGDLRRAPGQHRLSVPARGDRPLPGDGQGPGPPHRRRPARPAPQVAGGECRADQEAIGAMTISHRGRLIPTARAGSLKHPAAASRPGPTGSVSTRSDADPSDRGPVMPIQVECPSCHASIRVRDEHAGRRGRCPHCKAVFARARSAPTAEPRARRRCRAPAVAARRRRRRLRTGRRAAQGKGRPGARRGAAGRGRQRPRGRRGGRAHAQDAHRPPGPRRLRRPDRAGPPHDPLPALGPDRRRGDGPAADGLRGDHRPGRRRGGVPRDPPRVDPPARPGAAR